jgi:hypothetical protein
VAVVAAAAVVAVAMGTVRALAVDAWERRTSSAPVSAAPARARQSGSAPALARCGGLEPVPAVTVPTERPSSGSQQISPRRPATPKVKTKMTAKKQKQKKKKKKQKKQKQK